MLKVINKYVIYSSNEYIEFFLAPTGIQPLKIDEQNDNIYLWALTTPVTKNEKISKYTIKTITTGQHFKDLENYTYVGTVQTSAINKNNIFNYFVLHFFIKEEPYNEN